jgi:hypothetical protein
MRFACLLAVVGGCSAQPPASDDSLRFRAHWVVMSADQSASCQAAGVSKVVIRARVDGVLTDLASLPCEPLEGTTGPLVPHLADIANGLNVAALDAVGTTLAADYQDFASLPIAVYAVQDLPPATLWLTGEPIAEMRRIFEGASAWWAQHPGSLPSGAGFTPAQGACCAQLQSICVADPALWAGAPWTDLAFTQNRHFQYSYAFLPNPQSMPPSFTVRASADLDCNGIFSLYEITGTLSGGTFTGIDDVKITNQGQ